MSEGEPVNKADEHSKAERQSDSPYYYWWKIVSKTFHKALHMPNGIWFIFACIAAPPIAYFMTTPKIAVLCIAVIVLITDGIFVYIAFGEINKAAALKPASIPSLMPVPEPQKLPASTSIPIFSPVATDTPPSLIARACAPASGFWISGTGSGGIKQGFESAFNGTLADWSLYLIEVTNSGDFFGNDLRVRCSEQPDDLSITVVFSLALFGNEYLKVSIDKYQMFRVTGTIDHVSSSEILLKDATMEPIMNGPFL
jgi:hypothetical protein